MFFTATPVELSDGSGMDNEELFGKVQASVTPAALISKGYLVAPKMYYTRIKTDRNGDMETLHESIALTFKSQNEKTELTHKMLVAMPDTMKFDSIMKKTSEIRQITGENIDIYTIKAGEAQRNGFIFKSREAALKDFDENTNPCIVVHCDTLAEGIDISGLTGVYIMRGLSQAKFIQTVGRCVRTLKSDQRKNGSINPKTAKKAFGLVNIAVIDGELKGSADIKKWYDALFAADYENIAGILSGGDLSTGGTDDELVDIYEKVEAKILDIEFEQERIKTLENFFGEIEYDFS